MMNFARVRDAGYPTDEIETVHTLERAQEFGFRYKLTDSYLRPEVYSMEFLTRELVEQASQQIAVRARSLYAYARFKDEGLMVEWPVAYKTAWQSRLAGFTDYIKDFAERLWNRIRSVLHNWEYQFEQDVGEPSPFYFSRVEFPKRLKPKIETYQVVVASQKGQQEIERIQEALLAQIAMFYKYDLKPQAVLAHPSLASQLIAAPHLPGHYFQRAATYQGGPRFAGLPVIACSELAQGAMVV